MIDKNKISYFEPSATGYIIGFELTPETVKDIENMVATHREQVIEFILSKLKNQK